ncbi:hypothetical protein JP75_11915 [Devosia riboflavina]|uniref:DJ-1/PfpI domain-containing protein n=1 Tax=Devosia riboflavina TaxID=46914 RepID=A0A087M2E2_9HYPH|nr:hypothetical protein [Devosia riboflavina]KFL31045.1 hypothetical protein JP75_11915 [Devosia riboflavina]
MRILMILIPDRDVSPSEHGAELRLERFVIPYYVFVDAGIDLVLASPGGGAPWIRSQANAASPLPQLQRYQADRAVHDAVNDTLALDDVHAEDFGGAFCIGLPGPLWLEDSADPAARMIARFLDAGKPVAVIPSRLDIQPHGSRHGLLIIGEGEDQPAQAARALLGALYAADEIH